MTKVKKLRLSCPHLTTFNQRLAQSLNYLVVMVLVCLMFGDANAVVRQVDSHTISWDSFEYGHVEPMPGQQVWQYFYSRNVGGKSIELETHIYIIVDPVLDNGGRENYMHGQQGADDYVKRHNRIYDEVMGTPSGFKVLSPYFKDVVENKAFPSTRKKLVMTNFEESSLISALEHHAHNEPIEPIRDKSKSLAEWVKLNRDEHHAFVLTSSKYGYRANSQIGGPRKEFRSGASASIGVSGGYNTEIFDIRTVVEEHNHAYDIALGRLAFLASDSDPNITLSNIRFSDKLHFEAILTEGEAAGWLPRASNINFANGQVIPEQINHRKIMLEVETNWRNRGLGEKITTYLSTDGYAGYKAVELVANLKLFHPKSSEFSIKLSSLTDMGALVQFLTLGGDLSQTQYRELFSDFKDLAYYFEYISKYHGEALKRHGLTNIVGTIHSNMRISSVFLSLTYHQRFSEGLYCSLRFQ